MAQPHPRLQGLGSPCGPPLRFMQDGVLSAEECAELVAVVKSVAAPGYRPHLHAATLVHIAHAAPWLLIPLVIFKRHAIATKPSAIALCPMPAGHA